MDRNRFDSTRAANYAYKTWEIMECDTKKAAIEMLRHNLVADDAWTIRGLLAIYAKQTAVEKAVEQTNEDNGVGFTGTDGNILSSFAKQVIAWQKGADRRYPTPLSPKQMDLLRKKMSKYAAQLYKIAKDNAAAAVQTADAAAVA